MPRNRLLTLDGRPMTWEDLHEKVDAYYDALHEHNGQPTVQGRRVRHAPGDKYPLWMETVDIVAGMGGKVDSRDVANETGWNLRRASGLLAYAAERGALSRTRKPLTGVWLYELTAAERIRRSRTTP